MIKKYKVLIVVIIMTLVVMISYSSILNINSVQSKVNFEKKQNQQNNNEEMDIDNENNKENIDAGNRLNMNNIEFNNGKNKNGGFHKIGENGGGIQKGDKQHKVPEHTTLHQTSDKLLLELLSKARQQGNQLSIEKTTQDWFKHVDQDLIKKEKKSDRCHYSNHRNYNEKPVRIVRSFSSPNDKVECDIPCKVVWQDNDYIDVSVNSRGSCTKSMYETLENVQPYGRQYDIVATTNQKCDVPLGYFSWGEYPYFKQPKPKVHANGQGLVAAFISNCGPQFRLDYMNRLIAAGIQVDSYGRCNHNKDQPPSNLDYNGAKMRLSSSYKFVMAFENSETDDYVTEKLFGVFTIGSVPIYHGAPNGKKFFPTPNAAIFVNDFKSPEDLAAHLKFLDENDDEYEKYLEWKKTGPTKEWMTVIDMLKVNGDCRTCIKAADLHRKEVGMVVNQNKSMQLVPNGFSPSDGIVVYVRERHTFWFTSIAIPYSTTYVELVEIISNALPHKGEIFSASDIWTKDKIINFDSKDETIKLYQNQEIEVIFVDLDFFWHSKVLPPGDN